MYIPLYPSVEFQVSEPVVTVGSNVTIICRSNQEAMLAMSYNGGSILASSHGKFVAHTLVNVTEMSSTVIYCIGRVGDDHRVATFDLTVCKWYTSVMWSQRLMISVQ